MSLTPLANLPPVSKTSVVPVANSAGVVDTGDKFATGVVDTSDKFVTGAIDTVGAPCWQISLQIFEMILILFEGTWEKMIHEKT